MRARRGRGEGGVYQRSDGRWAAAVSLGKGPDGRRRRKTVYGEDKASVLLKLGHAQASAGVVIPHQVLTVESLLDKWLAAIRTTVKASSWARYAGVARRHITPALGLVQVDRLTTLDVQQLVQAHQAEPSTARYVWAVLYRALRQAARWGLVTRNVAADVEHPRQKRGEVQHWTRAQAKRFQRGVRGHPYEALFVLAMSTGLRQGELFALEWDQVDLRGRTISVTHSQEDVAGHLVRGTVKSKKSRRLVTLDGTTVALLRKLTRAGARVFNAPEGGPLRKSNFIRRIWAPAVEHAGLPPLNFHGLRHTHATLLLLAGVHPKVVSERLGHASVALTLDTYSHAVPSMQLEAAEKMGAILTAK